MYWLGEKVQRQKKQCVPLCSTTHITQSLIKPKLWMAVDFQACIHLKETYSPFEQCCSTYMNLDSPLHSVQQLGLPDPSHGWSEPAPEETVLRRNALCCMSTSITKIDSVFLQYVNINDKYALQEALALLISSEKSHSSRWNYRCPQRPHHHVFSKQERAEFWPTNPATPITQVGSRSTSGCLVRLDLDPPPPVARSQRNPSIC